MTAEEHLSAGRLDEALAELQEKVKKQPADAKLRVFLFQLLSVMGRWDRALTQLQVAGEIDPKAQAMTQTYREALRCELLRAEIFAGKKTPLLFGKPADWMAWLVQAVKLSADGNDDAAAALRDRAFEAAPATTGKLDGEPFAWLADADSRLGPMLEAIVNGRYYWIPFNRIKSLRFEKPSDLRDVVWTPANVTFANGGETVTLIPTRYPGTEAASDSRLKLSRATDWVERPGGAFVGLGQRLLATDQGEKALMDVRVIELDVTEADAQDLAPGADDASAVDGPSPS